MHHNDHQTLGIWHWLWGYASGRIGFMSAILLSILLVSGNNLLRAHTLDRLIMTSLAQQPERLLPVVLIFLMVLVVGLMVNATLSFFKARFGAAMAGQLREDFFRSLLRTPQSKLDHTTSGNILSLYNKELNNVADLLAGEFVDALLKPLLFLAASVYMVRLNWKLYLICYAFLPVISFVIHKLLEKSTSYASKYYETTGYANELAKECIDGIVEIKSFGLEEQILKKCKSAFDDVLYYILKAERCDAVSIPIWLLNNQLPKIMCILFGSLLTFRGELTIGELVAYTQLTLYVSRPASSMLSFVGALKKGGAALQRLLPMMDRSCEPAAHRQPLEEGAEEIVRFQDVTFGYDEKPILAHCSFTLGKQGFYVLAGASGQGKSTILDLICGLYPIQSGAIQIQEQLLRKGIAYVPQDNVLFEGTIADNIAFGWSEVLMEDIEDAAKAAEAHELICTLPDGYHTWVGERGQTLSGGQKQRIAIARALLRKSPLILLDEPTASLDPATEEQLMRVLNRLSRKCALLVTSHRLSTIREADHIYVMESGRIVETGTHLILWAQHESTYYRLYREQIAIGEGEVAQ